MNVERPESAISWWSKRIASLQFDTLVRFDDQLHVQPWLAKQWFYSLDGKVLTLKLRQNLKFSDGSELKVQDVVASLRRWATSQRSVDAMRLRDIASIDQRSEDSLEIKLKTPFTPLLSYLATPRAGISKVVDSQVLGTGPWILQTQQPATTMRFTRNKFFLQAPSKCERLELVEVKPSHLKNAFKEGRIDIIDYYAGLETSVNEIRTEFSQKQIGEMPAQIFEFPAYEVTMLFFSLGSKKRISLDARKRFSSAIFKASRSITTSSYSHPATSIIPAGLPLSSIRFNVQAIKSSSLRESLVVHMQEDERFQILKSLANKASSDGIEVDFKSLELKELYRKHALGDVTAHVETLTMQIPDPFGILSLFQSGSPENFSGYSNVKFDDLLQRATRTHDSTTREALYKKALGILELDAMLIPLIHQSRSAVVSSRVRNYLSSSVGPFYANYHQLDVAGEK